MRLTPLRRSGLLGAATMAAVATLALVTTAFATPDKPAPDSGDTRATAYSGNVDINHDDACTVGGLTGEPIAPEEFEFTGGEDQQDLDITGLPEGVEITGVVVKGAEAYNVYLAAKLGEQLPWNDLKSPDKKDNVPNISHWYACGVEEQPSSSSSPSSSSATSSSTVTHSSTPSSSQTTTPSSSEVAATTTTTAAVAAAGADNLASTGFGSAWLVGLGAALLAAGAAVLLVLRRRSAS